jgi:hypothetical protein
MASPMDAHAKPPEAIRQVYKHFQKLKPRDFDDQDNEITDTHQLHENDPRISPTGLLRLPANIRETFIDFAGSQIGETDEPTIYSVNAIPGKSADLNIGSRVVI